MFDNSADFDFDDEILINSFTEKPKKLGIQNTKNVLKRKFPGPAGLLPARKSCHFSFHESEDTRLTDEVGAVCSQTQFSCFEEQPWQQMCKDLDQKIKIFNVEWIKTKAALNQLIDNKAPYLVALIDSLEVSECKVPTVKITLKDQTGQIPGSIVHKLYKEYSNSLTIGSVLVLKEISVLTIGLTNHYLVITPNNLQTIYTKNGKIVMNSTFDDLEDELDIPDNFEETAISQSLSAKKCQTEVETNIFEGLDASDFFDDF